MENVEVFTDGSSSKNGKKDCLSGSGVYFPKTGIELSMGTKEACKICEIPEEKHSNNIGELLAILLAMVSVENKSETNLTVYSDSMYCISSITTWFKKWQVNGWKTANGGSVKNQNIIKKILELKKEFKSIFFVHVKAHLNEPEDKSSREWFLWDGNNRADLLAGKAIKF